MMTEDRQTPTYYPLFLDIRDMVCIVVGGGKVAERKARMLLAFGARVKVISPHVTNGILKLRRDERVEVVLREYRKGDLKGAGLVFAATNEAQTNALVKAEAVKRKVPINVADRPQLCDFIVPSIIKKGPLVVALSTSGTAPGVAKRLKAEVDDALTRQHVDYLSLVARFRRVLQESDVADKKRKAILKEVLDMDIGDALSAGLRGLKERFLPKR
jgi:precorrin-2 dehydrogenase / sirohydrochlorin ferrochelatase